MSDSGSLHVLLAGCGKMGGAILNGLLASSASSSVIVVIDPAAVETGAVQSPAVTLCASPDQVPPGFVPNIVILAVKPQNMAEVVPSYSAYASSAVFLSIAAGITLKQLATMLGESPSAITRSMPNLPASIGQGITVAVANDHTTEPQQDICSRILRCVGAVEWIEDERLIDAVTALSGSGPAYVFACVEAMAKAGVELGLPEDMAQRLARQTVIGSGALLARSSESATTLRRAVTSKGGTTEAALTHLLEADKGLFNLMQRAMQAAASRAKELAKG